MGVSTSSAQLARKLNTYAGKLADTDRRSIERAAIGTKAVMIDQAARAAGPDRILSGTTRTTGTKRSSRPSQGRQLGVRYKIERKGQNVQAFVRATGPWQLVEEDIAPHIVVSRHARAAAYTATTRNGRTRRGANTRQARIASVLTGAGTTGGRRAVLHWGSQFRRWTVAKSKGRHPWKKGLREAESVSQRAFVAAHADTLVRSFR